ncbi:hypothetical protein L2E82_30193 [Cichorium intybus]|uniref:Uncharacterized protein n=2 Tax=Cichorium intybus TaxID=13427 RepID=A0ACB9CZX9_CICIN|nr:hypothetical protein L2E82_30187 [Cichorium intybus]KAI3739782.1 hypothetical protein L2E82_30193 [Cichorium intybus]
MLTYCEEDEALDQFNELKEHQTNSFDQISVVVRQTRIFLSLSRRPFSFSLTARCSGLRRWFIIYSRRFKSRGRSVGRLCLTSRY